MQSPWAGHPAAAKAIAGIALHLQPLPQDCVLQLSHQLPPFRTGRGMHPPNASVPLTGTWGFGRLGEVHVLYCLSWQQGLYKWSCRMAPQVAQSCSEDAARKGGDLGWKRRNEVSTCTMCTPQSKIRQFHVIMPPGGNAHPYTTL